MAIHGGDTGQARDIIRELGKVYDAIESVVENYPRNAHGSFMQLNLEGMEWIQIFDKAGLDYMHDMSGGRLTDRARKRLEAMADDPKYAVFEESEALRRMAKSERIEEILGLLTPTRLAMIIAYEHDLPKKEAA